MSPKSKNSMSKRCPGLMPSPRVTVMIVSVLSLTGCATPSWETGDRDRDTTNGGMADDRPASLVEVSFGGGEAEVTKNLPADAADKMGEALKTLRGKSPPSTVGE